MLAFVLFTCARTGTQDIYRPARTRLFVQKCCSLNPYYIHYKARTIHSYILCLCVSFTFRFGKVGLHFRSLHAHTHTRKHTHTHTHTSSSVNKAILNSLFQCWKWFRSLPINSFVLCSKHSLKRTHSIPIWGAESAPNAVYNNAKGLRVNNNNATVYICTPAIIIHAS